MGAGIEGSRLHSIRIEGSKLHSTQIVGSRLYSIPIEGSSCGDLGEPEHMWFRVSFIAIMGNCQVLVKLVWGLS